MKFAHFESWGGGGGCQFVSLDIIFKRTILMQMEQWISNRKTPFAVW